MSLQITSRCCEVSLALTYVKIQIAINNYHDRQKINQLRLEARDLKRIILTIINLSSFFLILVLF
jgi:hypothetical protein